MKSFIVKSVLAVCLTLCCLFYLDIMYEQKISDPIAEVNKFNFVPEGIQLSLIHISPNFPILFGYIHMAANHPYLWQNLHRPPADF